MVWWICQGLALYWQIDPGLSKDGRFGDVLTHRIRIGIGLVNWSGIGIGLDNDECGVVVV